VSIGAVPCYLADVLCIQAEIYFATENNEGTLPTVHLWDLSMNRALMCVYEMCVTDPFSENRPHEDVSTEENEMKMVREKTIKLPFSSENVTGTSLGSI
jgi:hypothetical protein